MVVNCSVLGCTNRPNQFSTDDEFICYEHWQLTDRDLRRLLHRVRRKLRSRPFAASSVIRGIEARTWQELVRQATERSVKLESTL